MKRMCLCVTLLVASGLSVGAQLGPPPAPSVQEFRSLDEIFRKLPAALRPRQGSPDDHAAWEAKLADWLAQNVKGQRLSLNRAELIGNQPDGHLRVAAEPFRLAKVACLCPSGVDCRWAYPVLPEELYVQRQTAGKAPANVPYNDYRKLLEEKNERTKALIAKLRLPTRKDGRVVHPGDRINVRGTIAGMQMFWLAGEKPDTANLIVEVSLEDVEVTE